MNKTLGIILLTSVGFAAGLGSGIWIGRSQRPCQPPPAWLYTEFADITRAGPPLRQLIEAHPDLWNEINAELATLRPRLDAFREELGKIDGDFRRDLEAILSPEQKELLAKAQQNKELPKVYSNFTPETPPSKPTTTPATSVPAKNEAPRPPKVAQERSDGMVSSFVFVPYSQARFTETLGLDEAQSQRLGQLLEERRTRFLKLCDDTPPPSLQLSRIAALIRKAAAGK